MDTSTMDLVPRCPEVVAQAPALPVSFSFTSLVGARLLQNLGPMSKE